ncbi:hypothetical protein BN1002_04686 [Bacillus sp. B-jedd]|nr:hypothetical protein BN1002_04686 [Bacillus sp. B-jedd]
MSVMKYATGSELLLKQESNQENPFSKREGVLLVLLIIELVTYLYLQNSNPFSQD